ncbi:MAG TPA: rhodanese-like domain-containing protein [Burkholderiaceae bacterium]|jgi:rhodanese-related sulfurtransferase|nr:rhodanese-like domain-containing protein [Burkholderiaceae bacterium]
MQLEANACASALETGAWLIDVREPHETHRLAFDHPHCLQMPLSQFQRRFNELPRDRQIVLACASGGRSFQAMHFLLHHGYTLVANLRGGIGSWAAHGLPVRRGA